MEKIPLFKLFKVELRYTLEFCRTYALGPNVRGYVEVSAKNIEHAIKIVNKYIREEKLKLNSPSIVWFKEAALAWYTNAECYDYRPFSFESKEKEWQW